jgi:hypothetical protein
VPNLASSSAPLTFLTNMGDGPQSTAPSAIQVKNKQQTVCIEEKLDIISQLEKGEQIVDLCLNGRFTHSIYTVHDDADRSANSVNVCCLCSKTTTVLSE